MSQGSQSPGRRRRRGRVGARAEAAFFGTVVTATDLLPPRIRYGYVHPLTAWMFRRPLRNLAATAVRSGATAAPPATSSLPETLCCALLTGSMEVGGIGSVVEVLAAGFPMAGVRAVVICTADGARADRLRSRGVDVVVVANEAEAERALRGLNPDVIQSHGAPKPLEDAAIASGIPVVAVLHNMEIHFSRARWRRFARLLGSSSARSRSANQCASSTHAMSELSWRNGSGSSPTLWRPRAPRGPTSAGTPARRLGARWGRISRATSCS